MSTRDFQDGTDQAKTSTTVALPATISDAAAKLGVRVVTRTVESDNAPQNTVYLDSRHVTTSGTVRSDVLSVIRSIPNMALVLDRTSFSSPGLKTLKQLQTLSGLSLRHTPLTGDGVGELKEFVKLRWIDLRNTQVTFEATLALFLNTSLESIQFPWGHLQPDEIRLSQRCTDSNVRQLSSIPAASIRSLNLADSQISDTGLADLRRLTRLESLDLSGTSVTDSGLASLAAFSELAQLNLADTSISDHGLASIATLANLADLDLADTRITDAGVAHLVPCRKLTRLVLSGTRITGAGLEQLTAAKDLVELVL